MIPCQKSSDGVHQFEWDGDEYFDEESGYWEETGNSICTLCAKSYSEVSEEQ